MEGVLIVGSTSIFLGKIIHFINHLTQGYNQLAKKGGGLASQESEPSCMAAYFAQQWACWLASQRPNTKKEEVKNIIFSFLRTQHNTNIHKHVCTRIPINARTHTLPL
jgi:hypothetical protein